jgi:two-component system phosphate regulon sensor histidine kinase PhoR
MDRIVMANEVAARLFHLPPQDTSARPLADCIPDRSLRNLLRGAHDLPACKEVEHVVAAPEGKRIFSVTVAPLTDGANESARGAVALIHEVTRERTAARMKTEFVVNASHELRAPLGGIKAYLEMLTDGEVENDQTRDRFYRVMQGEVERLGNLVENILNIARIEAGIVKVSKEQVPLTGIVQEVVESLRPQAATAGVTLNDELLPVFFHVHADKEMMRRAVFNLVSNAVKYTPQGGSVLVHMHVDEAAGEVTVGVSDTGVGISEQDLSRLFQKFFRVESSKKMASGTGLGLVLVKEIVENLHGGRVSATSSLGKGSTFSLTLPLVRETQPPAASDRTNLTRSAP